MALQRTSQPDRSAIDDGGLTVIQAVLDVLAVGVLLLARDGVVRLANAEAALLLGSRSELQLRGQTLQTRRTREQGGLNAAIRDVFTSGKEAMIVFRNREEVAELALNLQFESALDLVVATVTPVRSGGQASAFALSTVLKLTPAEMRLARRLQAGDSLSEAAASTGITVSTARSTLRLVLAKSGTKNQAGLAALLMRLSKLRRDGRRGRTS